MKFHFQRNWKLGPDADRNIYKRNATIKLVNILACAVSIFYRWILTGMNVQKKNWFNNFSTINL